MQASSLADSRSIERRCKTTTTRARWLLLLQIWAVLAAPILCENIKLSSKANSIDYGVRAKRGNRSLREKRFISIDNKAGDVDVDLELKIPFLSFPLENKNGTGLPMPLVKLNAKALAYFAALLAILTLVLPVLFKELPPPYQPPLSMLGTDPFFAKEHKRRDRGLDIPYYFGNSLEEILEKNINLGSCVERLVCSAVAMAKHANKPTSLDSIIDTLYSYRFFEKTVNSTTITEAAEKGRQVLSAKDCATTTSECFLNQKILLNVLKMIGL